ncbi:MAG: lipid-binding SYLF domain-containing protein [Mucilaginibacter sp.]|uniref:lipid-binding SYLF domain-containing protein n=1 Tax=Mucilaginibacter sp. L3T2-6 TaxID=3062491 RepID=UPI0026764925|nr:lipid-binding SYLF domain-containing protein [Mucilaginibacter sp. L3T2-6]MDO3641675.1 lipid-binding SYLF domain-containing protein [Mucilaginibacter sp. L3T2-6]MDV6214169.1 lipid-binding SYLF domain-containing protein [Mucilaginibacter sp. L3T2-6]
MKTLRLLKIPVMLGLFFVLISATTDDTKETERVHAASNVLRDFGKLHETIPHNLLSECEGVVIIPKLINAGLIVGGKRGRGVAMVKMEDGKWSDPVFVTMTGGSIGAQIGVQSVDLVLVFRHKGVLAKVKNGDFTVGGDASAAAGPLGRSTSANTDYKLDAEIYSYSRSRGLFAGISINGSNLAIDKTANANFYGDDLTSKEIFNSSKSDKEAVKTLKASLNAL